MSSDWVKPPESISALRALVGNTKQALQCFGFSQIVQTLCDSRAQFFKNYIPGSQKFISLIHQNVHLKLLRCRCKNSKRFSNFRPPQLPRGSSANSVYMQNARGWQRLHMVFFFFPPKGTLCCFDLEAMKFPLESDEVLCSPEILSGGFTRSLIILVDIECIDYSWIFDCWVSRFLKNHARESNTLVRAKLY